MAKGIAPGIAGAVQFRKRIRRKNRWDGKGRESNVHLEKVAGDLRFSENDVPLPVKQLSPISGLSQ